MDDKQRYCLGNLIMKSLANEASEDDFAQLRQSLKDNSEAMDYYMDYVTLYACLESPGNISFESPEREDILNPRIWKIFAEYEGRAEAIEEPKPEPVFEPLPMVKIERTPRVINRFSLYTAILSLAALVFLLLYIKVASPAASSVATIMDSVNARWESDRHPTDIGSQLWNNQGPYWLLKGVVTIEFDYGAEVVIEGPAEFDLQTPSQMVLYQGQVYAKVPKQATGFMVETPYSTVIDLGTEFGVKVDNDGTTDVHLIKGRASVLPGANGHKTESHNLLAGQARRIDHTGHVMEISLRESAFVREGSSESDFIWRGEALDLADLINGGNGFGTGQQGACIDFVSGELSWDGTIAEISGRKKWDTDQSYITPVNALDAIDCVIVPSQKGGDLPLSTTGLRLVDFPVLLGDLRWSIQTQSYQSQVGWTLNGQPYGVPGRPAVSIHANSGITFDLDKIRMSVPSCQMDSFTALCGVSESRMGNDYNDKRTADVAVLLDGQEVYRQSMPHVLNNAVPVKIDLGELRPRFLTLLVTCGEWGNDHDWCIFGEPRIELSLR